MESSLPNLYFIRGYNRVQTRNSILINADVDVVDMFALNSVVMCRLQYQYFFDGPHFPEIGLALYCEKGKGVKV